MRYDKVKHNELVAREGELTQEIETLRARLHDAANSDKPLVGERQVEYGMNADEYLRLREDRQDVRAAIKEMELVEPTRAKASQKTMLSRFLRSGSNGLAKEEMEAFGADKPDDLPVPLGAGVEGISIRGATRSDDATGEEVVEETIVPSVIERLVDFGGLDRVARKFVTGSGNEFRWPGADNASKKGRILAAQNTAVVANDLAPFTVVTFHARTATSDPIVITREMLTDSIFDVGAYAETEAIRRMGRSWDEEFTDLGDGSSERARSLKNSVTVGHNQTAADTLAYGDLVELVYSVNRAYRKGGERGEGGRPSEMGRVGFLMTDSAEKALDGMVDSEMRPLWVPSIREGVPDRLLGYPYEVTTALDGDHMSAPNTPYMWFGDFSYYGIRTVGTMEIFRFFDSRTAVNNTIEILGYSRRDARAMGAQGGGAAGTTEAIKSLTSK